MKPLHLLPALLLPLALHAQTAPGPGDLGGSRPAKAPAATGAPRQVTEVTEDLDPATSKVIRRTTRTYSAPAGTADAAPEAAEAGSVPDAALARPGSVRPAPTPAATRSTTPAPARPATGIRTAPGSDPLVSEFLRESVNVDRLRASELPDVYNRFIEKVRDDRRQWHNADWDNAAAVLSRLNTRYEQVRQDLSFDDRLNIRTTQGEFQTLRTARQVKDSVTDKL